MKCPYCGINELLTGDVEGICVPCYNRREINRMMHACPVCHGQGTVSKPPWVTGDVVMWTSDRTSYPCQVCGGAGIVEVSEGQKGWETK
jgi:RecJ-like exonuclease